MRRIVVAKEGDGTDVLYVCIERDVDMMGEDESNTGVVTE